MVAYCFGFCLIFVFSHLSLAVNESFKNNIKEIRANVLKKAATNSSLFDPQDVKYLKEDDWPILRFLHETNNDKEKAEERVVKSFAFRKKELAKLDYFPAEFHRQRLLMDCGSQSIAGRPLLQMKVKRNTHVDNVFPLLARYFSSYHDKFERNSVGEKGVDVLVDFEGYGLLLFDPKFKTIAEWTEHYPTSRRNVYMYRFPWVYQTLWGLIKSLLPQRLIGSITFVDSAAQLAKYVKFDQLAKDLGGTNECKTKLPDGVESGICQSKFNNIKEEDWKKFYGEAQETFKEQADSNGYKSIAELFQCKNNNSANEIIKRVAKTHEKNILSKAPLGLDQNINKQLNVNQLL